MIYGPKGYKVGAMVKMSETKMIFEKLQTQDAKLDRIESTLVQLAVQDNEIRNMQKQLASLWDKINLTYDPDGVFSKILESQATMAEKQSQCEVHNLSAQIKWLWATIAAMALGVITNGIAGGK